MMYNMLHSTAKSYLSQPTYQPPNQFINHHNQLIKLLNQLINLPNI